MSVGVAPQPSHALARDKFPEPKPIDFRASSVLTFFDVVPFVRVNLGPPNRHDGKASSSGVGQSAYDRTRGIAACKITRTSLSRNSSSSSSSSLLLSSSSAGKSAYKDEFPSLLQSLTSSFSLTPETEGFEVPSTSLRSRQQVVCREPIEDKFCVDLDATRGYKPPRPPKDGLLLRTRQESRDSSRSPVPSISRCSSPDDHFSINDSRERLFPIEDENESSARMRVKRETKLGSRDKMTLRNEALRYWRSIHNKYSVLNDFNRQRRSAMVKKQRQRNKDRNKMSIFFVIMFMIVFLLILLIEVFFIDEQRKGTLISGNKGNEFDPLADIPDYLVDDKKLVGELEIDAYRRQELSVKGKISNDQSFFRKNIDETHLSARVSGNVMKALRSREKREWLVDLGEVTYYNSTSPSVDAKWMAVYNLKHKFYVYSAFYDDRKGRIIRVIGATQTKKGDRVWCKYWYANSSTLIVNGAVKIIRENWNLRYSACFIACPLTIYKNGKEPIPPPESVSIMTDPGGNATNKLTVLNLEINKGTVKDDFAICVKPLHFEYNNVNQIIEFIELNQLIGVKHFTLYNHTIGSDVDCILKTYLKTGVVKTLPWKLNIESQKEIRTEGLFAALNDCLYRYMYQYKYILMIDLDEYIVPHSNHTLSELIAFLKTKADEGKVGAVSFQNAFFYLQWPDDPNSASLPPLVTLRKTRRRQRFHPHKQRSKYIAVNPYVVEAGNHFVWEFLPGHGTLNVPNEVGFLHHYRVCEFGGDDCVRNPRTTDTSMYRYKDILVKQYTKKLKDVTASCSLEDLSKSKDQLWSLS